MRVMLFTGKVPRVLTSGKKIRADPDRIVSVVEYPAPKNLKALRPFLGMVGDYAGFLERDSEIRKGPLTRLLRKGEPFVW